MRRLVEVKGKSRLQKLLKTEPKGKTGKYNGRSNDKRKGDQKSYINAIRRKKVNLAYR